MSKGQNVGPSSQARSEVIDAFRGIAILSVLVFHYTVRWAPPKETVDLYGYDMAFPGWLEVGAFGVHLFFVISGLVITMTVLRSASVWEFAARRFARIYPAFVAAAATTFVLMQFGPDKFRVGIWDLLANLVIDARILGYTPVDGAYWSLFVEVKFYAFVALSRLVLGDKFWIGLIGLAVVSVIALQYVPGIAVELMIAPYWPFFLLGIGAWLWIAEKQAESAAALLLTSMVLYGVAYSSNHPAAIAPLLIDAFVGITSMSMLVMFWLSPTLRVPMLASLGRISYSLYLVHQYVGVSLIGWLTAQGLTAWPAILIAIAAMIGTAAISFRYVEQPGNLAVMRLYRHVTSRSLWQSTQHRLMR